MKTICKKQRYVRIIAGISLAVILTAVVLSFLFPGSYESALDNFFAVKFSKQINLTSKLVPEEFWAYAAAQGNSSISEAKASARELVSSLIINPDFPDSRYTVTGESKYKGAKLKMIKEYLNDVYGIKPYWVQDCRKVEVLIVTAMSNKSNEPYSYLMPYDLILIRGKWYVARCSFNEDETSVSVAFFPDWPLWYEPAY